LNTRQTAFGIPTDLVTWESRRQTYKVRSPHLTFSSPASVTIDSLHTSHPNLKTVSKTLPENGPASIAVTAFSLVCFDIDQDWESRPLHVVTTRRRDAVAALPPTNTTRACSPAYRNTVSPGDQWKAGILMVADRLAPTEPARPGGAESGPFSALERRQDSPCSVERTGTPRWPSSTSMMTRYFDPGPVIRRWPARDPFNDRLVSPFTAKSWHRPSGGNPVVAAIVLPGRKGSFKKTPLIAGLARLSREAKGRVRSLVELRRGAPWPVSKIRRVGTPIAR